jgi:hypothetical protein
MPFSRIVESDDDAKEYYEGEAEDKISNTWCDHYFFLLLIMKYRTTIASEGITVNMTVANIDMSI